jgi:hypothetical protein
LNFLCFIDKKDQIMVMEKEKCPLKNAFRGSPGDEEWPYPGIPTDDQEPLQNNVLDISEIQNPIVSSGQWGYSEATRIRPAAGV